MTPDALLDGFGLAAGDEAPPLAVVGKGPVALVHLFTLSGQHLGAMVALVGLALLVLMLAPRRHAQAVDRLARPFSNLLLGLVVLLPLVIGFGMLVNRGIMLGRGLLAVLAIAGIAAGVSVCARALGERVLAERGPLAQTAVGLLALVLPLAAPVGLVVLVVAAPLGLGAFLRGRRPLGDPQ